MTQLTITSTKQEQALPKWKPATWEDYLAYCEDPNIGEVRLFYNQGYLFVDMGNEGINHSKFARLFAMLFLSWFTTQPEQIFDDLGGCVIEKPKMQGASPDLVL